MSLQCSTSDIWMFCVYLVWWSQIWVVSKIRLTRDISQVVSCMQSHKVNQVLDRYVLRNTYNCTTTTDEERLIISYDPKSFRPISILCLLRD